jgi:putative endopeptidase
MASAMFTKEERRDLSLQNNPRSIDQVKQLVPAFNWDQYFSGIGIPALDTVIVMQLKYMEEMNGILGDTDIATLKEYIKWSQFNQWSAFLNSEIEKANFDFYYTELDGIPEMKPRDESVLGVLNNQLGEALGKLYVDEYFPPEAKAIALDMVENLKLAFGERIRNLDWMSDTTKQKALDKLDAFNVKIGYPDKWKDYSKLEIRGPDEGGTYISNMINYWKWIWEEDLGKMDEPVDKSEWHLPPQVVNAYYSPLFNEIVFPAAILQPPFYNYRADPAVNFGGIGAVIGHEMSHGFDDKGSMFDKDGNLKNWWQDEDRERFFTRAQKLIDQFDGYEPFEGVHVNGKFTLGENIGDLGGVNIAYDGLQRHLAENGDPGLIDGYTQDQRFFISWGTIWRTKMRDEALRNQIKTDPHTPGMYRAIGPLENLTAFYNAFGVEEGNKHWTADSLRVHIW